MNPETQEFEPVTRDTPEEWKKISVGEVFMLNGIKMKVRRITKKDVVLRRVKR